MISNNSTMPSPSLIRLFLSFLRLGLTAFGGPAMIAHVKELSVKKNKWLDDDRFKDGLVLCQSIPGATVMQMAGYVGLRVKGIRGALASYVGFGLPAYILMLLFSILYDHYHDLSFVHSLFSGLQVLVVAIIAQATYSFGKNSAKSWQDILVIIFAAGSLGIGVNPFLVIPAAGLVSIILYGNTKSSPAPDRKIEPWKIRPTILLLLIFMAGLIALYFLNINSLFLSLLMMKIDLFAFGGGFTSIPLMLHEVVEVRGWMDEKTFMNGIALGQVTPGPIIITATFVGYLWSGFWGSLVATLSIFTPSFLMLVIINPVFDRLKASPLFLKARELWLSYSTCHTTKKLLKWPGTA
ncbi:MAG: chromate efflux transporter [Deltaproteobacteria bacterium]|nr:chromate efflux transporter [Deltaproteobacteria bacterium]